MTLAEKVLISGGTFFLMQSYVFGVVKYRQMMSSKDSKANFYVNMSHNSPLLYITATLLLTVLAHYSSFPEWVNTASATSVMAFFISANLLNNVNAIKGVNHTVLKDVKADGGLSKKALSIYIVLLVIAQVGGSATLALGAMIRLWA